MQITLPELVRALEHGTFRDAATIDDLRSFPIATSNGAVIQLHDVATLRNGVAASTCQAIDGQGHQVVEGIVYLRWNNLDRANIQRAAETALDELRATAPRGMTIAMLPADSGVELVIPATDAVIDPIREALTAVGGIDHLVFERGRHDEFATDFSDDIKLRIAPAPAADVRNLERDVRARLAPIADVHGRGALYVQFFGNDDDLLRKTVASAAAQLRTTPIAIANEIGGTVTAPRFVIDRRRASELGISRDDAETVLDVVTRGHDARTMTMGERSIPIVVRLDTLGDPNVLPRLLVAGSDGVVPLSSVVSSSTTSVARVAMREDGKRFRALYVGTANEAALRRALGELQLPAAIVWRITRDGI